MRASLNLPRARRALLSRPTRSKEAVDSEPLFDFLRDIVTDCPAEERLPGPARKQKAPGDAPAAKRQRPAKGKGPTASTADALPPEALAPLEAEPALLPSAAATSSTPTVPAGLDLFGTAPAPADEDDDYDAE